jgi:CheY-like chemotaxis protein
MENPKMGVLVIDDDPDDLDLFCEAIRQIDPRIECLTAATGQEGFSILEGRESLPSIIFLDLNMPHMNGKECLMHIRRNPGWNDVGVIMYTTYASKEDIDFFNSRNVPCLRKQSTFDRMVADLRDVVSLKLDPKPGK